MFESGDPPSSRRLMRASVAIIQVKQLQVAMSCFLTQRSSLERPQPVSHNVSNRPPLVRTEGHVCKDGITMGELSDHDKDSKFP